MPKQLELALMLQSGLYDLDENTLSLIKENTVYENHSQDSRYTGPRKIAPAVVASYGTSGNNITFVNTYCIAANTINRADKNGGNGTGVNENVTYTLTQNDIHAVFNGKFYQDKVGCLTARDYKGISTIYVNQNKCVVQPREVQTFAENSFAGYGKGFGTITASGGAFQQLELDLTFLFQKERLRSQSFFFKQEMSNANVVAVGGGSETLAVDVRIDEKNLDVENSKNDENGKVKKNEFNLVRRLTPLECERLMGFPDNWTFVNEKSSDSPRYKALGNSIVVPCLDFIFNRLKEVHN